MPSEKQLRIMIKLRNNYQKIAHTPEETDVNLGENPLFETEKSYDDLKLINDEEFHRGHLFEAKRDNETEAQYINRLRRLDNNYSVGDAYQSSVEKTNEELKNKFKELVGTTYYAELLLNSNALRTHGAKYELNKTFSHFKNELIKRYGRELTVSIIDKFIGEYLNPNAGIWSAVHDGVTQANQEHMQELLDEQDRQRAFQKQRHYDSPFGSTAKKPKKDKTPSPPTEANEGEQFLQITPQPRRGRPKGSKKHIKDPAK